VLYSRSAENRNKAALGIPVWCARFNTTDFHASSIQIQEDGGLVLQSDVPFSPSTPLYIRVRAAGCGKIGREGFAGIRTIGVMEVKWCQKAEDYEHGYPFALGVQYMGSFD